MSALVKMGYQCQFGVLQAGHFGVAQNRKRAILLAAAPDCILPHFPIAQHVFEKMPLSVNMDEKTFDAHTVYWRQYSAPYRSISVRDAISDLPSNVKLDVASEPKSHFQRLVRWRANVSDFSIKITHHDSRILSPIVMARIALIPKAE